MTRGRDAHRLRAPFALNAASIVSSGCVTKYPLIVFQDRSRSERTAPRSEGSAGAMMTTLVRRASAKDSLLAWKKYSATSARTGRMALQRGTCRRQDGAARVARNS